MSRSDDEDDVSDHSEEESEEEESDDEEEEVVHRRGMKMPQKMPQKMPHRGMKTTGSSSSQRGRGPNDDDDDDSNDEDDDSDDAYSSEEEEEVRPRKRPFKKPSAAHFFEDEAGVDEDYESDEGSAEEGFEDLTEEVVSNIEQRRSTQHAQFFEQQSRQNQFVDDEEEARRIAEEIKTRHAGYGLANEFGDDILDDDDNNKFDITQQSLLPSVRDPKLWVVPCKVGLEREIVVRIMKKFFNVRGTEKALLIKSAVAPDHIKGYIYIEAEKEAHVKSAVEDFRTLQKWKMKRVRINEMPDVLKVNRKKKDLPPGSWVRVARGTYKGDLASVYVYDESTRKVTVRIIPRLDLAGIQTKRRGGENRKRNRGGQRMPQRFFNKSEIIQCGLHDMLDERRDGETGEQFYIFDGLRFKDGYVYKTVNIATLNTDNIVPTLSELQKFQHKEEKDQDDDDERGGSGSSSSGASEVLKLAFLQPKKKNVFAKGDTVHVIKGDLINLRGVVRGIEKDHAVVKANIEGLEDQTLNIPYDELAKYFRTGDHVKVLSGRYQNETGTVVKVELESGVVILISDMNSQELKVLSQDIQLCKEVTGGLTTLGNYALHDLVQLNPHTVGVIVRVEREGFKVLDNNGNVKSVRLADVGNKRNTLHASGLDQRQNQISVGDAVRVVSGPKKGKRASIQHIHRVHAFLHSKDVMDNGGVYVVRTSEIVILGAKREQSSVTQGMPTGREMMSPGRILSRGRGDGGRGNDQNAVAAFGGRGRGRDPLLMKTVRIIRGPRKGYQGIVKQCTPTHVRVELQVNMKLVSVKREQLTEINKDGGAGGGYSSHGGYNDGNRTPMHAPNTPMHAPNTPMHAPNTPMHAPNTPSHRSYEDAPATPGHIWDPSVPNTPGHQTSYSDDNRSWTPQEGGSYGAYDTSHQPSTPGTSTYSPFPGYGDVNTPALHQLTPQQPHTPGAYNDGYTPSHGTPSQYRDHPTPDGGAAVPRTPMLGGQYPDTPMMNPNTPDMPPPHTPGGAGYEQYHNPAAGGGAGIGGGTSSTSSSGPRLTTDILVRVASGVYAEQEGVIREIRGSECLVVFPDSDAREWIAVDSVALTKAGKKDLVKVLIGTFEGEVGVVVGSQDDNMVVKIGQSMEILGTNEVAKYVAP